MEYIIVQAGGKGTRLGYLTKNKPKALAPVDNLPKLFHLFRKYPDKKFIVIADYQKDVLRNYLNAFAEVKYEMVVASGIGTCSGVKQSIELIPDDAPFMLVWSDLILPEKLELPEGYSNADYPCENDYIGVSQTFPCRWKFENGDLQEERSSEYGVAGFFLFRNKKLLSEVPESGELVRWMRDSGLKFKSLGLAGTREFGLLEEYEKLGRVKTRPFNRIPVDGDVLIKEPVDDQGRALAVKECAWYEKVKELNITGIPKIYSTDPLKMENIKGKNIYECDPPSEEKKEILTSLVSTLRELHSKDSIPADSASMKEAYFNKTMQRLSKVEELVPYAKEKTITVNGRVCRNIFYYKDILEKKLDDLKTDCFSLIHGDCTFSNLMIRDNGEPVLIDPRGYFGFTSLYGDERYDWAKLYYSLKGNYDTFNLKEFSLDIGGHSIVGGEKIGDLGNGEVRLDIRSNGWEDLEEEFFSLTGCNREEIKLLHAVIWLSLTTYAWQDYDSVCGSFYNGLYYLEEVL